VRNLRNPLAVASLALLAALAAGCGGDDSSTASDPAGDAPTTSAGTPAASDGVTDPASEDPGLVVTDGITPDDLVACLTGAGLDAVLSDSTPLGVEVPVAEIELSGMTGYSEDTEQGGYLYVFADPATAQEQASIVTLGGTDNADNSRFAIHQNVVRALSIIVSEAEPSADEQALFGCLPPADQGGGEG
jgi:hypothetical protein